MDYQDGKTKLDNPTPYRVEQSQKGCSQCNIGSTWQVVYSPSNRALDVHYGDPQQAEYMFSILVRPKREQKKT